MSLLASLVETLTFYSIKVQTFQQYVPIFHTNVNNCGIFLRKSKLLLLICSRLTTLILLSFVLKSLEFTAISVSGFHSSSLQPPQPPILRFLLLFLLLEGLEQGFARSKLLDYALFQPLNLYVGHLSFRSSVLRVLLRGLRPLHSTLRTSSTTGQVSYGRGFPPPATPTTGTSPSVTAGRSPAGGPAFPRPLAIRRYAPRVSGLRPCYGSFGAAVPCPPSPCLVPRQVDGVL